MTRSDAISVLKHLAGKYDCTIDINESADGVLVDVIIERDGIDLYVGIPKLEGRYVAHDITSSYLPREVYPDVADGQHALNDRTKEILSVVECILAKKIEFHRHPSLFNKERGYIAMPVNGEERRAYQKRNYFGLPEA